MITFKVASTLDSMVGYKNEAFIDLGWAGARLDDIMNFIPARLSLIVLFLGAVFARWPVRPPRIAPLRGMRIALRDRLKHESPNSAHAESFVAGALGVRLGGPTQYSSGLKQKPWLNEKGVETGPEHIRSAIRLIHYTVWITTGLATVILLGF
jgi:adenosylcobinamide-phosphate synthase